MTKETFCEMTGVANYEDYLMENLPRFAALLDLNYVFVVRNMVREYINISVVNHMMEGNLEPDTVVRDILGGGDDFDDNAYEYVNKRMLAYDKYADLMHDYTTEEYAFLADYFTYLVQSMVFNEIPRIKALLYMITAPYVQPEDTAE